VNGGLGNTVTILLLGSEPGQINASAGRIRWAGASWLGRVMGMAWGTGVAWGVRVRIRWVAGLLVGVGLPGRPLLGDRGQKLELARGGELIFRGWWSDGGGLGIHMEVWD